MYVYIAISQQHTKTEQYCFTLSTEEETDNGKLWHHPQHVTRGNLTNFIIRVAISRSTINIIFDTKIFRQTANQQKGAIVS